MDKMQALIREVQALERELNACTRCGMCLAHCPLFAQTGKEADVSRGKIALIQGLIQGLFEDADGVRERLHQCLLCGSCAKGCPSGVNTLEIFMRTRVIITRYLGLPLIERLIFKKFLAHPDRFNKIMGSASACQGMLLKADTNLQGTFQARGASFPLKNRHFLPLSRRFFLQTRRAGERPSGSKALKVAFFVGCLVDKVFPSIANAVVRVLDHFGVEVVIPEGQGCCGMPALASGDGQTFESLVRRNLDLFSEQDVDYLVTACATCTSAIVHFWPSLMPSTDSAVTEKIRSLAGKTLDIHQFLVGRFDLAAAISEKFKDKEIITYHDPCHLKKSLGIFHEPRRVILAAGHELREMKASDACCGMGGSFNLRHYDLSRRIGLEKARNIAETGCRTVASGCPACMMQLSDMLARIEQPIRVVHPMEIYAEALLGHDSDGV